MAVKNVKKNRKKILENEKMCVTLQPQTGKDAALSTPPQRKLTMPL